MFSLDDSRVRTLKSGYGEVYDISPTILALQDSPFNNEVWDELWGNLHHQGNVHEASYAAVPYLVHIYGTSKQVDWQTYSLVGTIELCRFSPKNPDVPLWLKADYDSAHNTLSKLAIRDLAKPCDQTQLKSIIGYLALFSNLPNIARIALHYTEDEISEMLELYQNNKLASY